MVNVKNFKLTDAEARRLCQLIQLTADYRRENLQSWQKSNLDSAGEVVQLLEDIERVAEKIRKELAG